MSGRSGHDYAVLAVFAEAEALAGTDAGALGGGRAGDVQGAGGSYAALDANGRGLGGGDAQAALALELRLPSPIMELTPAEVKTHSPVTSTSRSPP